MCTKFEVICWKHDLINNFVGGILLGGGGGNPVFSLSVLSGYLFILIIKRISRAPVYHTKWEHKVLYNNTNDRHAHARICVGWGDRHGMKNNLEMIIKQVRLEMIIKQVQQQHTWNSLRHSLTLWNSDNMNER